MKKVVNELKTININELTDKHIIGLENSYGEKSLIVKVKEEEYIKVNVHNNDYVNKYTHKTILEAIESLYEHSGDKAKVFVFDNKKEFTSWFNDQAFTWT
jgi:pyruvate/oxaloacetate carboxyltransferase